VATERPRGSSRFGATTQNYESRVDIDPEWSEFEGLRIVVKTIVHSEIPAGDVEKVPDFYGKVFGGKFEKAETPGREYWLIRTGSRGKSARGGMYKKMSPDERPRNYVAVDQIDSAIELYKAAGGTELVGKMEVPGMELHRGRP
jgi:predicted enzyme related to lactoylglutathione lyase